MVHLVIFVKLVNLVIPLILVNLVHLVNLVGSFALHLLVQLWWDEVQNEWDRSQLFCTVYVV